jgi:hypothetical protein
VSLPAREGTQELDEVAATAGRVRLDPARARQATEAHLARAEVTGTISVSEDAVTVTVNDTVQLQMLGPATVGVEATATATARKGND